MAEGQQHLQSAQQQEVRNAVVETFKSTSAPESLGPATTRAREIAKDLRERLDLNNPTATMKHRKEMGVMAKTDTETPLKKHIGTELTPLKKKDEEGNDVNTEQGERLDRARAVVDRVRKLEEQGFDRLESQNERDALVEDVMEHVIRGREDFDGLPDDEKRDIAENILRDPGAVGKIADTLRGRLENPKSVDSQVDADLQAARKKVEGTAQDLVQRDRDIRDKKKEVDRAQTRQEDVDKRLSYLVDHAMEDTDKRDTLVRTLKKTKGSPDSEKFKAFQMVVAEKIRRGDGNNLTGDEEVMREYLDVQGRLDELPRLQAERDKLPKKIYDLTDQFDKLKDGKTDLKAQQVREQQALERAIDRRNDQEGQFVTELESALAEGANEWFDEAIDARNEAAAAALKEKEAAEANEDKKQFYKALNERLYKLKVKRNGKVKPSMNKRQVYKDAASILEDGPEKFTTDLLMERFQDSSVAGMPDGPDKDKVVAQNEENKRERERLEQWLRNNSDQAESLQNYAVQQIMTARMRAGPIYEGETLMLRQRGLEPQVQQAIRENEQLRTGMETLINQTGPASVYEGLRHYWGGDSKEGFPGGLWRATIWSIRWGLSPTFLPNVIKAGYDKYYRNKEVGRTYPQEGAERLPQPQSTSTEARSTTPQG